MAAPIGQEHLPLLLNEPHFTALQWVKEHPGQSIAIASSIVVPLTGTILSLAALKATCRGYYLWISLLCAAGAALAPLAVVKGFEHCLKEKGTIYQIRPSTFRLLLGISIGLIGIVLLVVTIVTGEFICMSDAESRGQIPYIKA